MNLGWEFFVTAMGLGFGLAMDAFSVSLANGLNDTGMKRGRMCLVAGTFAGFQGLMPLLGWICIKTVADKFALFQKAVPWIALLLLCWIGGKMLWEGLKPGDGEEAEGSKALTFGLLAVQGIATSIDALSVGFNMVDMQYSAGMAALSAALIALLTFFICYAGLYIGKKFGTKLANKASVLGGVILVAIGFWIFFS